VLPGVGLLGCTPSAILTHGTVDSCVEEQNDIASIFDFKLKSLVDHFNNKFSADSKFILINNTLQSTAEHSYGNNFSLLKFQFNVIDRGLYNI